MPETILAIRMRRLGDVLSTLNALDAIKRADGTRRVLYMIDSSYHKLLSRLSFIDSFLETPPSSRGATGLQRYIEYIAELRRLHVDCVLDFHSNPRSGILAFLSGAPRRIGYDVRVRKMFYTEIEPRAYYRDGRKLACTSTRSALRMAERVGTATVEDEAICPIPVEEGEALRGKRLLEEIGATRPAVALNPGDPYPAKEWPEEYFVELARRLSSRGLDAVILWGPGERNRAERIALASTARLAPRLPLEELPGFLVNFSLVVTIDSGLKHLAVAVRVPTLTIFGPTSWEEWHMGTDRDRFVTRGLSCSPCRLSICPFGSPCMREVTPALVENAAVAMTEG